MFTIYWNNAPEWANYITMDEDGEWYWYENEPYLDSYEKYWCPNGGESILADSESVAFVGWKDTLYKHIER